MNHHPDKLEEMPNHMALAAAMSAAANGQGRVQTKTLYLRWKVFQCFF